MTRHFHFNKIDFILSACVFMTIISQAPFLRLVLNIDTQIIIYPCWFIAGMVAIFNIKKTFFLRQTGCFFIMSLVFALLIFLFEGITGQSYITSYVTFPFYFSILIYFVGASLSPLLSKNFFKILALAYVAATLILGLDIFFEYFTKFNFSSISYIYRSKNSAAHILLIGIVFCLYMFPSKKIIHWIIKSALVLFFSLIIIFMRARAAILSIALLPIIYFLMPTGKRKIKFILFITIVCFLFFVFVNGDLYNLFIKNILLKATSNTTNIDANYITSNRLEELAYALYILNSNIICGHGFYYLDIFYVNSFVNYGLFCGILLIAIAFLPLFALNHIRSNYLKLFYLSTVLCFLFNGFFEGLSPFGPGSKCFILWLAFGIIINNNSNISNYLCECDNFYEKSKTFIKFSI